MQTRNNIFAVPAASGRSRVTLEPLRSEGPDAISAASLPRLRKVVLKEIHTTFDNLDCDVYIRIADDLFAHGSAADGYHDLFPEACTITKAVLDFYFSDSPAPHAVSL